MSAPLDSASLEILKKREGRRLSAYQDIAGVWTIGDGITGPDIHEGLTITDAQADAMLAERLQPYIACVDTHVTVPLNEHQRGALVSFVYNVGCSAFEGSTLLRILNAGDYAGVPAEMLKWVWIRNPSGKKIKSVGLENRRNSEGGQWATGSYVSSSVISPEPPVSPWNTVHVKVKALGSALAASGVTGGAIADAGGKVQALGSSWQVLAYVGIALTVVGILLGIFKKDR